MQSTPKTRKILITIILLSMFVIPGLFVGILSPVLPDISKSLSLTEKSIQTMITMYFIGYGLGTFLFGFLTDVFGRRKLLLLGLFGFTFGIILPVTIPHIIVFVTCGLIQGAMLGALSTIARGALTDIHPPHKMLHMGTLVGIMWGIGPIIGPVLGGYLSFYFGWKIAFVFCFTIALCALIAVFLYVPETFKKKKPLEIRKISRSLKEILSHKYFVALALLGGVNYAIPVTFNTLGSFVVQNEFKYSSIVFGYFTFGMGLILILGAGLASFLTKHFATKYLMSLFTYCAFIIATIGLGVSHFLPASIVFVILISALMYFSCGMLATISFADGMTYFRHIPGSATAIVYLLHIFAMGFASFILEFLDVYASKGLMLSYFGAYLISIILILTVINVKKK